MTEQARDLWPFGPGRIETLAHGALDAFAARVKAAALAGGGALTPEEIDALVAFLQTLTDTAFLTDPKFANPFAPAAASRCPTRG
ncbi:MAG: hypothetical protein IH786_01935 [Proteobacteria bacterium]|nr:hypothetical protein [Pseudomonadota bacterium]